jgi:hypothetical protein
MEQRSEIQPVAVAIPNRVPNGLPRWEQLPAERRSALILTLTALMVKRLAGQSRAQRRDDG